MFDFKAGMTIEAPEGLLDYGDDLVGKTVANVLGTALEAAGFKVASLSVKGHEKTPTVYGSFAADEVGLDEMDETDTGAVLGA